jgi:ACS family hexuronate transporter-like MFS transporter
MGIWGWQEAFIFTGAIGFIWLVAWRIFYQKPADQKKLTKQEFDYIHSDNVTEEAPEEKAKIGWFKLFTLKPTWAFIVGKFFTDPIWYFFLFWLPLLFQQHISFGSKKAKLTIGVGVYSCNCRCNRRRISIYLVNEKGLVGF